MINYKFIVAGRGEGKTKKLVECLIDSINSGKTCLYIGSYASYTNITRMYESIMHKMCSLIFIENKDSVKSIPNNTSDIDLFTDELTNEFGYILKNSIINNWSLSFNDPTWYITLDKSFII